MDFFETIQTRQSCRSYDPHRPVGQDKLDRCIEAARISPSACNSQPWHYYVVTDPEKAARFAKCLQDAGMNRWSSGCPAFVAVTEDGANLAARIGGRIKDQQYAQIDIGISVAQFILAATAQGLSTCVVGWFNEDGLRSLLGLPASKRVRIVIAVGYAATNTPRALQRKATAEISTIL